MELEFSIRKIVLKNLKFIQFLAFVFKGQIQGIYYSIKSI